MNGVFITGTDTDAGKTVVSSLIVESLVRAGLKVSGLKPIASGFDVIDGQWVNSDVASLTQASNVSLPSERINRYAFKPAIAPHIAAQNAGLTLSFDAISQDLAFAQARSDFVLVEGVGGWHVPLESCGASLNRPIKDIESLALSLKLPVVMVVGLRLGCLNHAVLTAKAIIASGAPLLGWVANHVDPQFDHVGDNLDSLEALLPIPKLFEVPYLDEKNVLDTGEIDASDFIKSIVQKDE